MIEGKPIEAVIPTWIHLFTVGAGGSQALGSHGRTTLNLATALDFFSNPATRQVAVELGRE